MEYAVSVIVPIYKAENYLHRCIDSILAQSFQNFQLVLVDDGSPDKSGEICDDYALLDSRIEVIHKVNGGVMSSRKCGIEHAKGVYSIQFDPDDWVEPTLLEDLYLQAVRENADMVICDVLEHCNRKTTYLKQEPTLCNNVTVMKDMFSKLMGSTCNKLIKTSNYTKYHVQFYEDLVLLEDLFLMFQLLLNPLKISYVNKALYHYDYVFSDYLMTMVNEIEEYDLLQSFSLGGPRNTIKTCKRFALDKTKTLRCIKGDNGDVVFPEVDMNNMATIWNQLYKKEVIDKYQLRFRSIQSEDELFSYEYMMYANSIKKIHYQGYFFVSNMDSLGSKHNYIAEYNYIELMENIYSRLISCWEIKDKDYIEKTKIRIANRLVYYVLKGYFVDTKVSKYERLKRWRYAKDDSFTNLKVIPEMSFRENSIYLVAKLGLYGLFDPILNKIIGK